jgi:hypothetical protein
LFSQPASLKARRGWGLYSSGRLIRLNHNIGANGDIFPGKFCYGNDAEMVNWRWKEKSGLVMEMNLNYILESNFRNVCERLENIIFGRY